MRSTGLRRCARNIGSANARSPCQLAWPTPRVRSGCWAPPHETWRYRLDHRRFAGQTKRPFTASALDGETLLRPPQESATDEPTIYALSTAPGRAAIAIVRISGPACVQISRHLCPTHPLPQPRKASVRSLYEPTLPVGKGTVLDAAALVLYFPGPRSVTGEDVLELHIHGGSAVVKAVLAAIPRCYKGSSAAGHAGVIRYAEAGEFTRRAFLNGCIDLTQVEALGDTLAAATEQQRRLAVRGTSSVLSDKYESWRQMLLSARGELEALIDFSEDQHFDESPVSLLSSVAAQVEELKMYLQAHITNAMRGELLRGGISISLLGAPNSGKSSLLNRLVGREAAIVSKEEGTTRDVVEVGIDIGGWYCRLGDTAGLRANSILGEAPEIGAVEEEGMRRAKALAFQSDLVIIVLSVEDNSGGRGPPELVLSQEVIETAATIVEKQGNLLVVINKVDLFEGHDPLVYQDCLRTARARFPGVPESRIFGISCRDASDASQAAPDPGNIQAFLHGLQQSFRDMTSAVIPNGGNLQVDGLDTSPSAWEESLGASERQRRLLDECKSHLVEFLSVALPSEPGDAHGEGELDIVIAAESLRAAAECLARITGKGEAGDVEEVLGVVFEKYPPPHVHQSSRAIN